MTINFVILGTSNIGSRATQTLEKSDLTIEVYEDV